MTKPAIQLRYKVLVALVALVVSLATFAGSVEIAVIVNPENSITNLSKRELRRIFLGKDKSFTNGMKVLVSNLPDSDPLRDAFYHHATGKSAKKARRRWAANAFSGLIEFPKECKNQAELLEWVSVTPEGIGYIDPAALNNQVKEVYRLRID